MAEQKKWIECYYGPSGAGKSESAAAVIKKIYAETGKTSRVIVGDGSAATYEPLVDAGIVELADYSIRDWPLSVLSQFCQGYFPVDPLDPKSPMKPMTPERAAKLGVTVIEGLSVGAKYIMGDKKGAFANRGARGEKIGQDSPIMLVDADKDAQGNILSKEKGQTGTGLVFGGNPISHFNVAQSRILGFIEESKALPGWVIWTAHEKAAEDKITSQKVIGPEAAGGALTASLSRVFNDTLHFTVAENTKTKVKDEHTEQMVTELDGEYRIYTRAHFRPEGNVYVKYMAVSRHPDPNGNLYVPEGLNAQDRAKFIKEHELPTYFASDVPGKSIIDFYQHIKAARARVTEAVRALRPAA